MRRIAIILFLLLLFTPVAMGAQAYRFPAIGDIGDKGASGHRVRAYGAPDDGSTDAEPEIATAVTAAAGGIVIFDQAATSYRISSNVTIPAGTTVVFQEGGLLSIDGGVTFTVNGTLIAGNYQIFSGAGSVTLAAGSCDFVVPQWWGAVGDDSTDCYAAFRAAIDSLDGGPGKMYIPSGTYRISATLDNWPTSYIATSLAGIVIQGAGSGETILVYKGTSGYLFELENDEANNSLSVNHCVIRDLHIQAPDLTSTGGGIDLSHASFNQIEGVVFTEMAATYGQAINLRAQTKTVAESGFTNDTNRDFTTTGAGATEKYAIKFSNTSNVTSRIRSVTVRLGKTGAPAGTIAAWIYSDAAGDPDAALSTASASVTNTALSANADGADVTFSWANYADRGSLATGVDGWLVLITTGYTYTDTTTEVRLRVDAGDGDVNEFATYDTGGGGWGLSDDGSNNTVILRTTYFAMGNVFDNIHIYGDTITPVGINVEDAAQFKIINSNIYATLPLQANFGGILRSVNTQFSGTEAMNITGGFSYFENCDIESGPVTLNSGRHYFTKCHIPSFIDSTDPTIVTVEQSSLTYFRGDNVGIRETFWSDHVYPITAGSPLSRDSSMSLNADADAITGEAGETTTNIKGFDIFWTVGSFATLPRGSYLVTIWAKTDANPNAMTVVSVAKTIIGGNTALSTKTYTLSTSFTPYRIVHVVDSGDAILYGTRLQVYKNTANANALSVSHITVERLGEDELYSGNPIMYSDDKADTDGARESELFFVGRQSGGEQSGLASIKASHDGAADDEKGELELKVNLSADSFSPTTLLSLDSDSEVTTMGEAVMQPSATQAITAVGDTILANATLIILNPDSDYILTSTPTIADGTTGQILLISCDNAETNTVTLQDAGLLGSSNLRLKSSTTTVVGKKAISFVFDGTEWIETGQQDIGTFQGSIFEPDGINLEWNLFHVDAEKYPRGIIMMNVQITLTADAAYSMPFEEWAGDPPAAQADIETVTTTGTDSYMEVRTTDIDNRLIDADDYIFIDIPATDVPQIQVAGFFYSL